MDKDPRQDDRAKAQRAAINESLRALNRDSTRFRDPGQVVYYVENSMATFNPAVTGGKSVDDKLGLLRQVSNETEAYQQRMRDLISAALGDAEIANLASRFGDAGFEIRENRPFVFEGTFLPPAWRPGSPGLGVPSVVSRKFVGFFSERNASM